MEANLILGEFVRKHEVTGMSPVHISNGLRRHQVRSLSTVMQSYLMIGATWPWAWLSEMIQGIA
jgi:hypothetical protein